MNPKNGRLNVGSRWFLVAVLSLFLPALGQGQTAPTSHLSVLRSLVPHQEM
jgi:hypothetical protein